MTTETSRTSLYVSVGRVGADLTPRKILVDSPVVGVGALVVLTATGADFLAMGLKVVLSSEKPQVPAVKLVAAVSAAIEAMLVVFRGLALFRSVSSSWSESEMV